VARNYNIRRIRAMAKIKEYNLYAGNKLIEKNITKKEMELKYGLTNGQINRSVFNSRRCHEYLITNIDNNFDCEKQSSSFYGDNESNKTYISNLEDGLIGIRKHIETLTGSQAILQAFNNAVSISMNCGIEKGKMLAYEDDELVLENKLLRHEIKKLQKEITTK